MDIIERFGKCKTPVSVYGDAGRTFNEIYNMYKLLVDLSSIFVWAHKMMTGIDLFRSIFY